MWQRQMTSQKGTSTIMSVPRTVKYLRTRLMEGVSKTRGVAEPWGALE